MDIKDARKEIDRIDRQMTALFRERLLLCDAIAKYKEEHGLPLTTLCGSGRSWRKSPVSSGRT